MEKLILLLLLFLVCLFEVRGQTIDWNAIKFSNSQTVAGKINGFNMGGYSYGRINNQGNNITVSSQCNQCGTSLPIISGASFSSMETKNNVINATAKLNPAVLRFPGGTHSGWYHLYEYDNQGFYDASMPQIKKGYGMTAIEAGHLTNPLSYCQLDSRVTINQNFIDGFVNYVQNIQDASSNTKKIEVSYVVNLLTHFRFLASQTIFSNCGREKALIPMNNYICDATFDLSFTGNEGLFNNDPDIYRFELYYKETQDALNKIVTELSLDTSNILYVEMGNEYYNSSGYPYDKYEMDVDDYSALVEIYSERLKCYFSDKVNIKIGVVTKPNTAWQTGLVENLNIDLSGNGETLSEVTDAVIYHHYYAESFCLTETDISKRFNCAKNTFSNHIEIDLTNNLGFLQNDFPNQKIWITEWNVLKGDDDKNNSYINTILHASFVQEYALGILEYNTTHSNAVSMLTHHRLGDHNVWSVIQTKDGSNTEANFRSGAYAMQYLSKLYENDNMNFIGNILTNGSTIFNTKDAKITAFVLQGELDNTNDKLLLFFSNKTETDISYSIPAAIDNINVDSAKISLLKGNYIFTYGSRNTTVGQNRFKETANLSHSNSELNNLGYGNIDDQFHSTIDSTLSINSSTAIPKNSIGVIEIFLDKIPTSLSEIKTNTSNFAVYPNPASHSITLSLDASYSEDITLNVYSILGEKVLSLNATVFRGKNKINLDTYNFTNGTYLLTFENKGHTTSKKIVINHF